MRFLIDENLPASLAADLVTAGYDILEVSDSEQRGADDSVIWRLAITERRILVARDLDFPLPKALGRPPGLVVMRPRSAAGGEQIRHLFAEFIRRVDLTSLEGASPVPRSSSSCSTSPRRHDERRRGVPPPPRGGHGDPEELHHLTRRKRRLSWVEWSRDAGSGGTT